MVTRIFAMRHFKLSSLGSLLLVSAVWAVGCGDSGDSVPGGSEETGGTAGNSGGAPGSGGQGAGGQGSGGAANTGGKNASGGEPATGGASSGGTPSFAGAGGELGGAAGLGGANDTGGASTGGEPASGGTGGGETGGQPGTGGSPSCSITTATWTTPVVIDPDAEDGGVKTPRIAVDAEGNIIAAWTRWSTTDDKAHVWAARRKKATGEWKLERLNESYDAFTEPVDLAMAPDGTAMLLLANVVSQDTDLYARKFDPSTESWGPLVTLEKEANNVRATFYDVHADAEGNFFAAFQDTFHGNPYVTRYDASTGNWDQVKRIDGLSRVAFPTGNTTHPRLVVSKSGDAVVVYEHSSGLKNYGWLSRYDRYGAGWQPNEAFDEGKGSGLAHGIYTDDDGDAFQIVYPQKLSSADRKLYAREWRRADGFQAPVLLQDGTDYSLYDIAKNDSVFGLWPMGTLFRRDPFGVWQVTTGLRYADRVLAFSNGEALLYLTAFGGTAANIFSGGTWTAPPSTPPIASGAAAVVTGECTAAIVYVKNSKLTFQTFE
jgi:hypothetical protein